MIKIDYPPFGGRIKKELDKELIFDPWRRRWIFLTPEEWVRQNFMQYLVTVMKYPPALVAIEKEIMVGEMKKRFDIVVYDNDTLPFMIVECKEMNVPLNEKVFDQVLRYNSILQARYVVITNGSYCHAFEKVNNRMVPVQVFPAWDK